MRAQGQTLSAPQRFSQTLLCSVVVHRPRELCFFRVILNHFQMQSKLVPIVYFSVEVLSAINPYKIVVYLVFWIYRTDFVILSLLHKLRLCPQGSNGSPNANKDAQSLLIAAFLSLSH